MDSELLHRLDVGSGQHSVKIHDSVNFPCPSFGHQIRTALCLEDKCIAWFFVFRLRQADSQRSK